jgi:hypothetical protein
MAKAPSTAGPTILNGWWVALALSIIVFLSSGTGFTIGPFLKSVSADLGGDRGTFSRVFDVTSGYLAAFGVAGGLLLIAAILSLSIDEHARPACRTVPIPSRPHPVVGG